MSTLLIPAFAIAVAGLAALRWNTAKQVPHQVGRRPNGALRLPLGETNNGEANDRSGSPVLSRQDALQQARAEASAYAAQEPVQAFARKVRSLRPEDLLDRFGPSASLHFGTAGLREPMGPGYNLLNTVVVVRATRAVLGHLADTLGWEALRTRGILIGYDARQHSETFAQAAAVVCASHQVAFALLDRVVPTPLVAFGVVQQQRCAGIMITASHNPKEYNGYKLYMENGLQISAAVAKQIEARMRSEASSPRERQAELLFATKELASLPRQSVETLWQAYEQRIRHELYAPMRFDSARLQIVHTALHGVADDYLRRLFAAFALPTYTPTAAQQSPDGDFPTVPVPNPEEGAAVLRLAMQTAEQLLRSNKTNAVVVLANDPDADRLAVAELAPQTNPRWHIFHGDEVGILFAWWMLQQVEKLGKQRASTEMVFINSVVSSQMLGALAEHQHKLRCRWIQHYPGFKWLMEVAVAQTRPQQQVLLVYEEALGYAPGGLRSGTLPVNDKDGIAAAIVAAQLAYFCHQNRTYGSLQGLLESLYRQYGLYLQHSGYLRCRDFRTLTPLFERIRQRLASGELVLFTADDGCGGGKPLPPRRYQIQSVYDWTRGYYCAYGCEPVPLSLPPQPKTHFMTFCIRESDEHRLSLQRQRRQQPRQTPSGDRSRTPSSPSTPMKPASPSLPADADLRITLRNSGTERKLKFYSELHVTRYSRLEDRDELRKALDRAVRAFIEAFLQPGLHGLEYGTDR